MKIHDEVTQNTTTTCPACGLLCDDIVLNAKSLTSVKNNCTKSIAFFEQTLASSAPSIAGKATDLASAIKAAADILANSQQALFAGLGTEVQGMRALMQLAEKTGATLDHMHSEGTVRNTLTLQNSGWQTTTLSEVKNRADLILVIGTDIVSSHPRFFEKLVWNADSLFDKPAPELIYLAAPGTNTTPGISPGGVAPTVVTAETAAFPEIFAALNALANNKHLTADNVAGIALSTLQSILDRLKAARYAVIVWSASHFKFAQAELSVQSLTQLIAKLNETNRVSGLALNSGDGDTSVNNTSTWISGYATRNRFNPLKNAGKAEYDTYHFSTQRQLAACDALLWISSFNAYPPPNTDVPNIVIGHPSMKFDRPPAVFIPVTIPGLDQAGTMFRLDSAVALPLKKLRVSNLPSLNQVVQQIMELVA
jgi:formylmethanofuran dehydrogenase subunit B